ncbi:MAG: polysaccharide export protein [Verrucomicrobia bacterium]|nr:polysaccharide export protein [Kiritimatiellia bacterium]MCP5489131.1 polysaccharide export protein [Verrucomicrobiota bacterium]
MDTMNQGRWSRGVKAWLILVCASGMGCVSKHHDPDSLLISPRINLESPAPAMADAAMDEPEVVLPEIQNPGAAAGIRTVENATPYELRSGDPVVVNLRGIYPRDDTVEDFIDEFGNITLPLLGDVKAAGRTPSELETIIRQLYIDGGYYRDLTVNVVMPTRSYYIQGEVRSPGRFGIARGLTLMQAISAAGGPTDFANTKSVKIIRSGETSTYNMRRIQRNPAEDVTVESGDVIVVDRSFF